MAGAECDGAGAEDDEESSDSFKPRATEARGGCGTTGHAFSLSMMGACVVGACMLSTCLLGANSRDLIDRKPDYGEWQ